MIKEGNKFRSTNTHKIYQIRQKVNCNSSFIVYLGTCRKCGGQYVGKSTQPFKRGILDTGARSKGSMVGWATTMGGQMDVGMRIYHFKSLKKLRRGIRQGWPNVSFFGRIS